MLRCLQNGSCDHDAADVSLQYNVEDFSMVKLTQADIDKMSAIFDFSEDDEPVGIFPDAVTDAYDNGLLEDKDEE